MPIPALNPEGFLPAGIFDCTLPELRDHFGTFQTSGHRRVCSRGWRNYFRRCNAADFSRRCSWTAVL